MKNIIFVCCLFSTLTTLRAQDTLSVKVGIFFAPQALINLKDPSQGSATITPVSLCLSFAKGRGVVNAMYNLTYNKVQLVYWHELVGPTGLYAVVNKGVFSKGGYTSLGVTRSVAAGRAVGFFEVGSNWHEWTPTVYFGAIIPLMFQVK